VSLQGEATVPQRAARRRQKTRVLKEIGSLAEGETPA
jgi:hypothetical protein